MSPWRFPAVDILFVKVYGMCQWERSVALDPSSGSRRVVSFGVFEVDLRSAELRKPGSAIRLQDKPLQILTFSLSIRVN